jgi:hypothetical protein
MRVRLLPHVPVRSSAVLAAAALLIAVEPALAREPGDPIRLQWMEGDLAGFTPILSQDGDRIIGFIEYHQRREGDRLEAVRVARFSDGSSDEDQVEARIGKTLEAVRGRSIIRDTNGVATVDITIDVAKGHIKGFSGLGKDREEYDEKVELPAGTYWGPLIFMVVKNFAQNSTDDKLVFRSVAPTPKPRVFDLELVREGNSVVVRPGGKLDVEKFAMRPTINWLVDPIIQRLVPTTEFYVRTGEPPALARYEGPRNYAGHEIRLE